MKKTYDEKAAERVAREQKSEENFLRLDAFLSSLTPSVGVFVPPPLDPENRYKPKKNDQVLRKILDGLAAGWSKSRACFDAGIRNPTTLRAWRDENPDFDAACRAAIEIGTDMIEDEAVRRAVHGVDKPVYQQGEMVGVVREYSDALMTQMLAGRRPERYARQRVEHTGADGGKIEHHVEVEFVSTKGGK